jgi:hypothetical protein
MRTARPPILAKLAFAKCPTWYPQLKTLTIVLLTTGALAFAAIAMSEPFRLLRGKFF